MKIIMIIILNVFAYMTLKLRAKIFGEEVFRPMIKNFKLSILPAFVLIITLILFIISNYMFSYTDIVFFKYLGIVISIVGLIIWILLLPNSTYLLTELNLTHRNMDKTQVPIWYDIVSVTSLALSGIMNTIININIIQYIYLIIVDPSGIRKIDKFIFIISAVIINILMSIGIYLGRNLRFYSWDILKPSKFLYMLKEYFIDKNTRKDFYLFISFHTIFLTIIFFLFNTNSVFLTY